MTRTIAQIETLGGQDELRRDDYFPTLVYSTFVHDAEEMNKEILDAIENETPLDEAIETIKTRSRQFAKRQHTWFRNMEECHEIEVAPEENLKTLRDRLIAVR